MATKSEELDFSRQGVQRVPGTNELQQSFGLDAALTVGEAEGALVGLDVGDSDGDF